MTVSAQTPINRSTGNGVTTVFPYQFKIIAEADIEVTVDDVVKTLNVDYTLSGVGVDAGGNVTFTVAPANATTVVRRRNMALTRITDYQDQGAILAETMDQDIDSTVLMIQQLDDQIGRSITIPAGITGFDTELPDPVASRFLRINSTGDAIEYVSEVTPGALAVSAYIETLLDDATAAAARTTLVAAASGLATASGLTMSTSRILARTTASTGAIEEKTGDEIVGMISTPIPLAKGGTNSAVTRQIRQRVTATRTTVGTGTTLVPSDDTIPQITEGDEYLTVSITPSSATSTLKIRASGSGAHTVAGASLVMCLFQDAVSNALAAGWVTVPVISYGVALGIDHEMTSGTTSAITFRIRVGADTAGTTTVNGAAGTRRYGGVAPMRITVEEILP